MELVACGMREQREEVVVANPVEVLDNLDDDLDRVEIWTTALSCFQHPTPEYPTDNIRMLKEAREVRLDVASPLESVAAGSHGQTRASQVANVTERGMSVARNITFSLGGAVRNTVENQPYLVITIALGFGWLLGRTHRAA
jgi:hypothetical protein